MTEYYSVRAQRAPPPEDHGQFTPSKRRGRRGHGCTSGWAGGCGVGSSLVGILSLPRRELSIRTGETTLEV